MRVDKMIELIQDQIPGLISFGIKVILALVAFAVGRVIIRWFRKIVKKSLERSRADRGAIQFLDSVLKFGLYTLLVLGIVSGLGISTTSVAALVASGGVAVGLALQGSLSNFAGGVLILLLKPFEVGDYIIEDSNHQEGTVKEIQIFYTKLHTIDNKTVVIPNGMLTNNSLTNATASSKRRLDLKIKITYESGLADAKRIIREVLEGDAAVEKDEILIFVDDLADSAVVIGIRAWVKSDLFLETKWRVQERIKEEFDRQHVKFAYPHLVVHQETK